MALLIDTFSQQFTIEAVENVGKDKAIARDFFGY